MVLRASPWCLGLGLASVKVQLPVASVDSNRAGSVEPQMLSASDHAEPSLLQGIAVLVVDDDAQSGDLVGAALLNCGASVTSPVLLQKRCICQSSASTC
jgi:hypothetical protein